MSDQKNSRDEQEFVSQIREALDTSVKRLDADTRHKIIAHRKRALDKHNENNRFILRWSIPAFAIAASVLITLAIVKIQSPITLEQESIEALELIVVQDTLDLYEELDFYVWLADEDVTT